MDDYFMGLVFSCVIGGVMGINKSWRVFGKGFVFNSVLLFILCILSFIMFNLTVSDTSNVLIGLLGVISIPLFIAFRSLRNAWNALPSLPIEVNNCNICGAVLTGKFCSDCGAASLPKQLHKNCSSCGMELKGKFCSECGKSASHNEVAPAVNTNKSAHANVNANVNLTNVNGVMVDIDALVFKYRDKDNGNLHAAVELCSLTKVAVPKGRQIIEDAWRKMKAIESSANNIVSCPRCFSTSLTANKKGYSVGKAAFGAIVVGPLGLAAGGMGSNKVIITCLSCGHQFKPGS